MNKGKSLLYDGAVFPSKTLRSIAWFLLSCFTHPNPFDLLREAYRVGPDRGIGRNIQFDMSKVDLVTEIFS